MSYPAVNLPSEVAIGRGVYTIHYSGRFHAYTGLADTPIYVGQARDLRTRLSQHAQSIEQAENLELRDFVCRWLVLAPVWIGLTEQILVDEYRPVWNAIRGFGNHDQGTTRRAQKRSQWDTLHPGRPWATSYQDLEGGAQGRARVHPPSQRRRRNMTMPGCGTFSQPTLTIESPVGERETLHHPLFRPIPILWSTPRPPTNPINPIQSVKHNIGYVCNHRIEMPA